MILFSQRLLGHLVGWPLAKSLKHNEERRKKKQPSTSTHSLSNSVVVRLLKGKTENEYLEVRDIDEILQMKLPPWTMGKLSCEETHSS